MVRSDVQLMLEAKGGDSASFDLLLQRYRTPLVNFLYRIVRDSGAAEDLAQEVFLRVYRARDRYAPSAKFTTWLMTITRNLVFNEMRRSRRFPEVWKDPEGREEPERQLPDLQTASPAQELLHTELQNAVNTAIAELPELQRVAIVLRRYENMPYEEIAEVLNVSLPAVKSIIFRARADLKEKLKSFLEN